MNDDAKVGDLLTPVRAVDLDAGENSRLQFSLLTGSSPYFRLTSDTGEVSVSELWSSKPSHVNHFQLFIGVQDSGNPVLVGASVVYRISEVVVPSNGSVARDASSGIANQDHGKPASLWLLVGVATSGTLIIVVLSVAIVMVNKGDAQERLQDVQPRHDKTFHQINNMVSAMLRGLTLYIRYIYIFTTLPLKRMHII